MHSRATVAEAIRLRDDEGLGAVRVARHLGLPVATVRDWHAGKLPRHSRYGPDCSVAQACPRCGSEQHDLTAVEPDYAYLLGLYLGDGCISESHRQVFRMRIYLDLRYPGIIDSCAASMSRLVPRNKINRLERGGSYATSDEPSNVEVSAYSKTWPCLFPQHGAGTKHTRRIWLAEWQQDLAERWPRELLRGLIQSDGSRSINTGRGDWRAPRYAFANVSTDITSIFCSACDVLGLRWTASFPTDQSAAVSIYVSRKADVARMDEFIGPKA